MRALLVTNLFPSPVAPTRGLFNLQRFRALASHCDVRVVCPTPWWTRVRRPVELLRAPADASTGLTAVFPTYWSLPRFPAMHGRRMYSCLRTEAARIRRSFAFDCILAAWAYPDAYAAAHLAQELGCPLVVMVLGSDINELPNDPGLNGKIRWTLGAAQRVVAVSRALRDRVAELGLPPDKLVVQHNGVDGERFVPADRRAARAELGVDADSRLIVYVGNLKREKGADVLVRAMASPGLMGARLALVGDGPERAMLESLAAELRGAERIAFVGSQPYDQIPIWMAACDLLCLPSRREGCPNVVLEALASGRPVVASAVGGVPELVTAENGLTVPADNPEALAVALSCCLQRSWDAGELRASVGCLSWDAYGQTLKMALEEAHHAFRRRCTA